MAYTDHFSNADDFLVHLDSVMEGIDDPYLQRRYLGFVLITAVTVFEMAIKEIFCTFAQKKHPILGSMTRSKFERINGRIKISNIQSEFIKPYGDKYLTKFVSKMEKAELESLRLRQGSIKSSYGNIIQWRHVFVHQGQPPPTTNYSELKAAYQRSKSVIQCLDLSMTR